MSLRSASREPGPCSVSRRSQGPGLSMDLYDIPLGLGNDGLAHRKAGPPPDVPSGSERGSALQNAPHNLSTNINKVEGRCNERIGERTPLVQDGSAVAYSHPPSYVMGAPVGDLKKISLLQEHYQQTTQPSRPPVGAENREGCFSFPSGYQTPALPAGPLTHGHQALASDAWPDIVPSQDAGVPLGMVSSVPIDHQDYRLSERGSSFSHREKEHAAEFFAGTLEDQRVSFRSETHRLEPQGAHGVGLFGSSSASGACNPPDDPKIPFLKGQNAHEFFHEPFLAPGVSSSCKTRPPGPSASDSAAI